MKLDIISGFLGSGKTTLIRKLMKELYKNEKILIIENEFGEISIDASILRGNGYELRELNSGCICCNISGDFKVALKEIVATVHVDRIIVEPSGIANLSDILNMCEDLIEVDRKFVVVDAIKFHLYLRNFESFFKDQIRNANVVVLSRVNETVNVENIIEDILLLNASSIIFAKNYKDFEINELEVNKTNIKPFVEGKIKFYNRVYKFEQSITKAKFESILNHIQAKKYLRSKGVVLVEHTWMHFEYASNQLSVEPFSNQPYSSFVIIDDKEVNYEL